MSYYNDNNYLGLSVITEIVSRIRREGNRSIIVETALISYLLYKQKTMANLQNVSFEEIISKQFKVDPTIFKMFVEYVKVEDWQNCQSLLDKYPAEAFYAGVMTNIKKTKEMVSETPNELVSLINKLFGEYTNKNVAEICCGCASYSISIVDKGCSSIDCVDLNLEYLDVLRIRNNLLGNSLNIIANNVFNISKYNKQYDYIFANYPLGVRFYNDEYVEAFVKSIPGLPPVLSYSSDWLYNTLLTCLLKPNGKAIAIMSAGNTRNSTSAAWRQWFIDNGLIESIISLPENYLLSTSVSTVLIVLSSGNHSVRMIDASSLGRQGRRTRCFNDAEIETIVKATFNDADYSKSVAYDTIRKEGFDLYPKTYLEEKVSFKHEVTFGSVLLKVSRGAQIGAQELDSLVTDTDTGIHYLQLKNISNGLVNKPLLSLKSLDDQLKQNSAKNNNLVIPKMYSDGKVALIEKEESETVVVSGNMFILDVDEDLVSPVYVKAFLESSYGKKLLRMATTGGKVPSINLKALKGMPFPLPDKETQKTIEKQYLAARDELLICRQRLNRAEEHIAQVFDEGGDWLA